MGQFIGMTALMFPFIVSIILPYVSFIAVVFVYNQMIADHEVPVMMSAGLSPMQLARPALKLAVLITALHYALTLLVIPTTQRMFYEKQWDLRYGLANLKIQDSTFTQLSQGLVAFVEETQGQSLHNLMISDTRGNSDVTILAKHGQLVKTDHGLTLATKDGIFQSKSDQLITGSFDGFDMDMNLSEDRAAARIRARQISTKELLAIDINSLYGRDKARHVSELGNRFLGPLMNLLLALIALTCLLKISTLRRRASIAVPLAIAGLIGSQSLFMGVINSSGGNINTIYAFGGSLLAAIVILLLILVWSRRHA